MPGSGRNGLTATNAGSSSNLAERHAPSALGYGTARPGSANCVEPGPLFDVRTFDVRTFDVGTPDIRTFGTRTRPLAVPVFAGYFAAVFTSANPHARRADVLFRSGPEIIS